MTDLTPTEDLVLEVLAARVRSGETCWVFEQRHQATLQSLETKGLLTFGADPTGTMLRAFLTDAGRAECLTDGYTEPVTRLREHIAEQDRRLEEANTARRGAIERTGRAKEEARRLRRQVAVLAGHLGGVTTGADLDALLWFRDVQVLHADGTTTTGRLGTMDDGYVVDTPNGPRPINPVGSPDLGNADGVDVVRPVTAW